jgi:hypothetical protein
MESVALVYPRFWVIMSRIISVVFHPLLVGVYMAAFIIFSNPGYFQYLDPKLRVLSIATVFVNNFLFPVIVVLLLRGLGFIDSIYLRTQKERIGPYMATIIFFFWTWYVFYNRYTAPQILRDTLQGIFYASILGSVFNIYFKISMHAMGVGGLVGMMIMILFDGYMFGLLPIALSVLIAGIVMSARLITADHQKGDVLAGFLVGVFCQLLAHTIL